MDQEETSQVEDLKKVFSETYSSKNARKNEVASASLYIFS